MSPTRCSKLFCVDRIRVGLMLGLSVLALFASCGGGGGGGDAPSASAATAAGQTESASTTPTPTPTPTPSAPTSTISTTCEPSATAAQALAQINAIRATARMCGTTAYPAAPPLQWNEALARAASAHATDMASKNYFSHVGQNGSTAVTRAQAAGYAWTWVGENISAGRNTMEIALADWLQSPGHCGNIMRADYQDYGIGCGYDAGSQYKTYWAQSFGAPR